MLGTQMTEAQIVEMMHRFDADESGEIGVTEFIILMIKQVQCRNDTQAHVDDFIMMDGNKEANDMPFFDSRLYYSLIYSGKKIKEKEQESKPV